MAEGHDRTVDLQFFQEFAAEARGVLQLAKRHARFDLRLEAINQKCVDSLEFREVDAVAGVGDHPDAECSTRGDQ